MKKKILIACSGLGYCGIPNNVREELDKITKEIEEKEGVELDIEIVNSSEDLNQQENLKLEQSINNIKEDSIKLDNQKASLNEIVEKEDNEPWFNKFPSHPNKKNKRGKS